MRWLQRGAVSTMHCTGGRLEAENHCVEQEWDDEAEGCVVLWAISPDIFTRCRAGTCGSDRAQ